MLAGSLKPIAALLICVLTGCAGTISSPTPFLTASNASWPFSGTVEIEARTLNDDHVWENREGKARLTRTGAAYRLTNPDDTAPTPETILFRRIRDGLFVAQISRGKERAYGLIVHGDAYYLFAFNRAGQNCTTLSEAERRRFGVIVHDDRCTVSNLRDLTGLLLYLRERFPDPTSAFTIR